MLEHILKTHRKARDHCLCMETVEKAFNAPYNAKAGIQTYFMNIEVAADDAKSLGSPHTDQQKMNKALSNFERKYGKEAHEAKDLWEASDDKTWTAFMVHWKDEVHKIETRSGKIHKANQAAQKQVDALETKMQAMQTSMNAMAEEKPKHHL